MMASADTMSIGTSTTGSIRSFSPDDDNMSTISEEARAVQVGCLTSTPCKGDVTPCNPGEVDSGLLFDDKHRGKNAKVLRRGTMAERRKKGCKEAVVMTNRPLRDSELFEVEIGGEAEGFKGVKAMLGGKGGSIRIGVTSHCPSDLWPSFPQSMKMMCSGTWMMKGDEVLVNGKTVLALQNRHNLKNLAAGDKLALMRAPEFGGSLIVFVNRRAVGIVATGVPDNVFGFVELYGDCDRVSITGNSSINEDCLPEQIKGVRITIRAKDVEIRRLRKEVSAKNDEIRHLNHQVEVLSRPPTPPCLKNGKFSSSSTLSVFSPMDGSRRLLSHETDGDKLSQIMEESTQQRRKRKRANCTIL